DPLGALAANAVSLTATMVVNTAAHRRLTFGLRGAAGRLRQWARAASVHLAGLALTTASLAALHALDGAAAPALEAAVALAASAGATGLRFLLMPAWIFRPTASSALRRSGGGAAGGAR